MEFSAINDHGAPVDWVRKFKEHLDGKLRFLQMIYGCRSEVYKKMSGLYTDAFNTKPFVESFNWNSFPYF
jgi:hypothetical protein